MLMFWWWCHSFWFLKWLFFPSIFLCLTSNQWCIIHLLNLHYQGCSELSIAFKIIMHLINGAPDVYITKSNPSLHLINGAPDVCVIEGNPSLHLINGPPDVCVTEGNPSLYTFQIHAKVEILKVSMSHGSQSCSNQQHMIDCHTDQTTAEI